MEHAGRKGNEIAIIAAVLLIAAFVAIIGNSFSGVSRESSSSEAPVSEVMPEEIPKEKWGTKTFTASDVIQMQRGEGEAPMGEIYQWGTRETLYFFGSTSQVKGMQYEGTGFIVKISDESISIFPTSTKMRVSSIMALDAEQNIIESTSRNIFNEGGVIISSRRELLGNTRYIIIGFEPT